MKQYETYVINQHVKASVFSVDSGSTFTVHVVLDEQHAQQILAYMLMSFGYAGWEHTRFPKAINGKEIHLFSKEGSGERSEWTDGERGQFLFEALNLLDGYNIGPVPVSL